MRKINFRLKFSKKVGNINNFIDVNEQKSREVFPQRPPSPPGSYAQTLPPELDGGPPLQGKAAVPPSMPPHLLRALLNTAPSPDDHTTLPLPHHVMVGHLYAFPRKDDDSAAVLGATHMYKSKYVTTVYYHKPTKHIVWTVLIIINQKVLFISRFKGFQGICKILQMSSIDARCSCSTTKQAFITAWCWGEALYFF